MGTQQRGEETRSNILAAAAAGFAEQGYDGTTVAEICRRADVSKGAFYHHFTSKQDLFLELLERWLAVLDEQLEELRTEEASVPEELLDMSKMICQVFQVAEDQLPIFLEFWTKAAHDPAVWEATIAPYRRYRAFFADMIESGITEGSLRPIGPDTAARVIVSLAVGLVVQGLLDTEGADWGHVAENGMQMLLHGIERKE
ncbi:MAG: TetR/AcrR family transcriptional regulator [Anaerolineae bacterium]|jgi:AcrR family transcriptional regulator